MSRTQPIGKPLPTTLQETGEQLYLNGYKNIIPIYPERKNPSLSSWQDVRPSLDTVRAWAATHRDHGVGLLAFDTPGIDIDVPDPKLANTIAKMIGAKLATAGTDGDPSTSLLIRLGKRPLLVTRLADGAMPFGKQVSGLWVPDHTKARDKSTHTRVEILANGQQYVIYGIHPSGKPYQWVGGKSPLNHPRACLPVLDEATVPELLRAFDNHMATQTDYVLVQPGTYHNPVGGPDETRPEILRRKITNAARSTRPLADALAANPDALQIAATEEDRILNDMARKWDNQRVTIEEAQAVVHSLVGIYGPENYEQWLDVGMALHATFAGTDSEDDALDLWDEWSQGTASGNYDPEACEAKWGTFKTKGRDRAIGFGTLVYRAQKVKEEETRLMQAEELQQRAALADNITNMNEIRIETEVIPAIRRNEHFGDQSRLVLANAIRKRLKDLTGVAPTTADMLKKLRPFRTGPSDAETWLQRHTLGAGIARVLRSYVYVVTGGSGGTGIFINRENDSEIGEHALDLRYERLLLTDEVRANGDIKALWRATDVANNVCHIHHLDGQIYLPPEGPGGFGDGKDAAQVAEDMALVRPDGSFNPDAMIVTIDGATVGRSGQVRALNMWRDTAAPIAPEKHARRKRTPEQQDAITMVLEHILMLCGGDELAADHLTKWIAHKIRYPGRKARHCVLVVGPQGTGKTWLAEFMTRMLGASNVALVSPSVLAGKFNGYAAGSALNIVEELADPNIPGFTLVDKLKDLITNPSVSVERKGRDSTKEMSVADYLFLTNHIDQIPIPSLDERRWFVVMDSRRSDFTARLWRSQNPGYFPKLYRMLEDPDLLGAVRYHLMRELNLGDWTHYDDPPITLAKREVYFASRGPAERAIAAVVNEALSEQAGEQSCVLGATADFVLTAAVRRAVASSADFGSDKVPMRVIEKTLADSGYVRSEAPVKLNQLDNPDIEAALRELGHVTDGRINRMPLDVWLRPESALPTDSAARDAAILAALARQKSNLEWL